MRKTAKERKGGVVHCWHKGLFRRTSCSISPEGKKTSERSSEVNCNNCRRVMATYMPLDDYIPPEKEKKP